MGKERKRNNDRIGIILKHVAIIMDGNGRWAEKQGLPRLEGHKKGVEVIRNVIEETAEVDISFLTLYAFSTENWKRPISEIQGLMKLFEESIDKYGQELVENKVRVRFLGRKDGLPQDLVSQINDLEKSTLRGERLNLNLAINYGGRDEILRAVKNIYDYNDRSLSAFLSEESFSSYLDTKNQPVIFFCGRWPTLNSF